MFRPCQIVSGANESYEDDPGNRIHYQTYKKDEMIVTSIHLRERNQKVMYPLLLKRNYRYDCTREQNETRQIHP